MLTLTSMTKIVKNIKIGSIEPTLKEYIYEIVEIFPPTCPVCNKVIIKKNICQSPIENKNCPNIKHYEIK